MTPEKKAQLIASVGSVLVRALISTLRIHVVDRAYVLATPPDRPLLWTFWHNRLFMVPHLFEHYFAGRKGAALTSASKDGEIVAAFLTRFGIRPVRGSSSRGGGRALVEMKRLIEDHYVMGITPDGPRGPRYSLTPGVVKLAQITHGCVLPIHIRYSAYWQLKTWDGFMIPKPFAEVEITLDELVEIPDTDSDEAFERERLYLEKVLHPPEGDERVVKA